MYIQTGQVFKWRQRKRKGNIVSILNRYLVMMPLVLISTAGIALAAPTEGVITGGSGTITQAESATNISQASPRLDINWQTFSTEVHESVNFIQPTADALAINRVIGGVPSELRGALNANGRVVILNDSGITFFGTSQVNVGALLATTATNLSTDGDRLSFSGAGYGEVLNQGYIHVSDGGFAVLAAPHVSNTGFIQANLGTIQLASANDFTVDFRGDGLIGFTVSKSTLDGIVEAGKALGVDNTGTLQAGSGAIGISAGAASSIVQSVVNLEGVVDASSFGAGTDGGTVLVTSVGDINIGGEVHADGGASGNGGTVTTWADGTNVFESGAVITARGGDIAGDGGLIEVSGNDVRVRGTVNASATNGAAGTFLIDPAFSITIANGAGTDSTATVFEENIENTSQGGTNVTLESETSIIMNDLADDLLQGGSGDITMTAGDYFYGGAGLISFNDKNDKIATTSGAISMTANDGAEGAGSIDIGHLETLHNFADITLIAGAGGIQTGNLSTGTDPAVSGFGTAHPGRITLETTNGGSINTGDISIHAQLFDSADAYFNAVAAGDLSVGNVSVKAIDPTSWASAWAGLNAGGDVTAGDVTVTADGFNDAGAALGMHAGANSGSGDVNAGAVLVTARTDNEDAFATVMIDAQAGEVGGDIHITGGINVNAETLNGGDDTASAHAYASINAGHDLIIDNGAIVHASAYNHVDSNASATADLYVNANHDMTINGEMTVDAEAFNDAEGASDANAGANLYAVAGNDIFINGPSGIVADASLTTSGTNEADADAYASITAWNNITVTGLEEADNLVVMATATNTGLGGTADADDDANAELYVEAGTDMEITGNVLVSAVSTLDGSAIDSAAADADADIYGNNITVNGDITVDATATNSAAVPIEGFCYNYDCGSGAEASADLYMSTGGEGGGDITIVGNTVVTASATVDGEATGSASANADAEIYADSNVNITGDITLVADAINNAASGFDASASADLNIEADNVTITGDTLVAANAEVTEGSGSASASASVDIWAGNNINVTGDITVEANALTGVSYASSASASADLYVNAGNDLTIIGDILVKADATCASCTESADADASADLYAGNDVNINGGLTVTAVAVNNGTDASSASASAELYVGAGRDLNITGDVLVKADETCASCTESAEADAYASLSADNDVNIKGDLTVTSVAVNNGEDVYSASADADLYVNAGNDINITGDILVTADATCESCYSASASAYADISAGHDITILTDPITVAANAVNGTSSATAYAALRIEAGTAGGSSSESCYDGECTPASGSIYITGDILATANADSAYGSSYEQASASVYLKAPDAITIRGADPLAYAPTADDPNHALVQGRVSGVDDVNEGQYHAELSIEAAIVDIEPKPVVAVTQPVEDNEHEVVSALETKELRLIEPLGPGKDPLSFDADGLASWATGAGVTAPSQGSTLTPDIEEAIAKGVDPTTVLPAPAAGGGMGLSSGVDAYSVGGPDFCDQVVSGYCLPQEGKKKTE